MALTKEAALIIVLIQLSIHPTDQQRFAKES
jgi:hypothetical protein